MCNPCVEFLIDRRNIYRVLGIFVALILTVIVLLSLRMWGEATTVLVFIIIPMGLVFCVGRIVEIKERTLPTDATPVLSPEKEEILNELAGEWDIATVSSGLVRFTKAEVYDNQIILSGGSDAGIRCFVISLSRTPAGRLYLDTDGSYIDAWDKASQQIHICLQEMRLIWRRPRRVQPAPVVAQAPEVAMVPQAAPPPQAAVVLPSWWEPMTDANGKVYYKNNYRMTTSWTPPTIAQIVEETRERKAQAEAGMEDPPPPAYKTSPAFESSGDSEPPPY